MGTARGICVFLGGLGAGVGRCKAPDVVAGFVVVVVFLEVVD